MRFAAAAAAAYLACTGVAAADPVGQYDVEGSNPGSGTGYEGTVAIERTGETFRVVWRVGGTRYLGTGIGNDKFLAVSYRSGNNTGLALYSRESNGAWVGVWTYADGRELGKERWEPR